MNMSSRILAAALMTAAAPWFLAPAAAVPVAPLAGLQHALAPPAETVRWRGGRGVGIGAGFVAGAIIGGAIAGSRPYGYGSYGYGGYGPGYVAPGYVDDGDEDYVAVSPRGGGAGYCAQRYRSYDPRSGTFLGFDGLRHPCP